MRRNFSFQKFEKLQIEWSESKSAVFTFKKTLRYLSKNKNLGLLKAQFLCKRRIGIF